MPHVFFRACHLCEAMCGVAIELQGSQIATIRGDRDDPFSRGHICPKAMGLKDVHEDPDRLRLPQRRRGTTWQTISWAEAFDEAAKGLRAVQRDFGRDSVAMFQGNPTVHNYGSMLFGPLFVRALGTRAKFSATSVDQLPHMMASLFMFGHQLLLPIPDLDRTRFLLIVGANPVTSNGSLMTAPGVAHRLKEIRDRGGKVVVVDPRRTETAEAADEHHFIRPGTDALFLAAVAHVLLEEGLSRPGRLAPYIQGLEVVHARLRAFSPERVAPATGLTPATLRGLARDLATAGPSIVYGRLGVCTQAFGGLSAWLINVINILTGNLDEPGGVMFTTPAVDVVDLLARMNRKGNFDRRRSRVRGLPEFGGEYPAAVLAEEIETPGPGQIRGLVTSSGNPVLSAPNGARLDRALSKLDFMVAIDIYRNETTRHAHLILPPTFGVEHDHFDLIFNALAVRNTVRYDEAIFPKDEDARHDWEIFLSLTTALQAQEGGRSALAAKAKEQALRTLGPQGMLDLLLRSGPYGALRPASLRPAGATQYKGPHLSLNALRKAPHGIDLGPLARSLPQRLQTPNHRIQLAPPRMMADLDRLEGLVETAKPQTSSADSPLLLIGRRTLRSNNSWMHNAQRLTKGPEQCTLLMHPKDAEVRGIRSEDRVRIQSRVGQTEAPVEISDSVMEGVVSLPHGWGHHRKGVALRVAEARPGASINDVTDEQLVDPLSGTAAFSGTPVWVTPASTP